VGKTGITLETVRRDVERLSNEMDLSEEDIRPLFNRLVDRLVERYVLLAYGRDQGITVTESEMDAAVDTIKADYPSEAAFRDMLLKRYVDFDEWEEQLREQILVRKIIEKGMEEIEPVTAREIRLEYDTHRESFRHPDMVCFRQIVTRTSGEAEKILESVRQGASLADLIRKESGPDGRTVGMTERWATREELEETLAKALFALPEGLADKPVKTPYGYHVVEVTAHRPEGLMSLPEAMERIEMRLLADRRESFYQDWIKRLQTRYPVKINRGVLNTLEIG
jgi:parvulin-like peptidyl-prolyl isomerase